MIYYKVVKKELQEYISYRYSYRESIRRIEE